MMIEAKTGSRAAMDLVRQLKNLPVTFATTVGCWAEEVENPLSYSWHVLPMSSDLRKGEFFFSYLAGKKLLPTSSASSNWSSTVGKLHNMSQNLW